MGSSTTSRGVTRGPLASRPAMVLALAAVVGLSACGSGGGDARPAPARTPAGIVQAYVKAYADQDAATACRLSVPSAKVASCAMNLEQDFAWYGRRHRSWRDLHLTSARIVHERGFVRADVVLRYRPADGGGVITARDTWWLHQSPREPLRIVRAEVLDSEYFGQPPGLTRSERPLTEAEAARPADLAPSRECGPTRRTVRIASAAVRDGEHRRSRADWLAMTAVEEGRTPDGARCLRLRARAAWRPSTLILLTIRTRPSSRWSVDTQLRITSDGRVAQDSIAGAQIAVGASERAVAIVLPRVLDAHALTIAIGTKSDQVAEPLLSHPSMAWQPKVTVRLAARRDAGRLDPIPQVGA
jgi:hypothetical protein